MEIIEFNNCNIYNCNSFSNGLIISGSNQTEPNDFIGIDWGKNNPVPEMNFQSINEKNNTNNIINNSMEIK
jgi:hypothetical protein